MKQSSAEFIAYDLRPAKQTERRILLDFLKCANECGIAISDSRYVGMGGTKFYDFHLMHRFSGVNRMFSLERHPDTHVRCKFNCPFGFIEVENKSAAEFMAADTDKTKTIYWFDYDDGIGPDITADITTLGTRMTLGGFAFVTVCGAPPRALEKEPTEKRLEYFQDQLSAFSIGLTADDMQNSNFPQTIYRVLIAAFKNAFTARTDGQFQLLFQIQYKDSVPMVTVGGCFCEKAQAASLSKRVKNDLPFLLKVSPYNIRNLNLTERERDVFDIAVTKSRSNSKQANSLKKIGFKKRDFETYKDLIRFLPRYHESII